jgi:hypothetical protein
MVTRYGSPEVTGSSMNGSHPPPLGGHKGPPSVHPTALAPTESGIDAQTYPQVAHRGYVAEQFGTYDLIDFVVVLIGSILSGEPTLSAFYELLFNDRCSVFLLQSVSPPVQ